MKIDFGKILETCWLLSDKVLGYSSASLVGALAGQPHPQMRHLDIAYNQIRPPAGTQQSVNSPSADTLKLVLYLFVSERDTLTRATLLSLLGTVTVRTDSTAVDLLKASLPSILCKFGVYLEDVDVGREILI